MRIAVIMGKPPAETFLHQKFRGLAERGFEVCLYCRASSDRAFDQRVTRELSPAVKVVLLPSTNASSFRRTGLWLLRMLTLPLLSFVGRTAKLIRYLISRHGFSFDLIRKAPQLMLLTRIKADVIHFEYDGTAASFLDFIRLAECPIVVSCRGSGLNVLPLSKPWLKGAYRELFERASRVHCVSHAMLEKAKEYGLNPQKAFVNYPSVDSNKFAPSPRGCAGAKDAFLIVSTGRLHWVKGYEYGLMAVRELLDRSLRVRYVILGGGPSKEQLLFLIDKLQLDGSVELLGYQSIDFVRELLNEADAYLVTSHSEGVSNGALEAMAMQVPVVTTDVGGMSEAVRDGIDGFVVPARDYHAIADRLEKLISDPGLREQMGQNARKRAVEHFSLEKHLELFIACYEELASRGS